MQFGPIQTIYFQPTTFCNLNCKYCYLPFSDRSSPRRMSIETLEIALVRIFSSPFLDTSKRLRICWHDGEPLSAGLPFFEKAMVLIEKLKPAELKIQNVIQTNGTLIDESWIQFFKRNRFDVGISIDGPEDIHNANRVDRRNIGSYSRTIRGIELMKKNGMRFSTISVLTNSSLEQASRMYEFFMNLGGSSIAFNVEEKEGYNAHSSWENSSTDEVKKRAAAFFEYIAHRATLDKSIDRFRELKIPLQKLDLLRQGVRRFGSELNEAFKLVSIGYKGDISTFSPELITMSHESYGDFLFGNVHTDAIDHALAAQEKFLRIYEAIEDGKKNCEMSCPYFGLCPGGEPSNKLTENGDLRSTETFHCQIQVHERFKLISKIMTEQLEAVS